MTGGGLQNTGADGPPQTSTGRSNRQITENPAGAEQGLRFLQEDQRRDGSETPELGQVENGSNGKQAGDQRNESGIGAGSGPSGMETERGNSSGQQGCAGSSGEGEGTQVPRVQERAVDEVAQTVANTGLEDGKAGLDVSRNVGRNNGEMGGRSEQEPEMGGRERRVPSKVYMLESSDEDEADVDDEEGEGLDEVDDLDGSWQTSLPSKHLRVLLVEDDDCTRHVVAALLRNCGYEGMCRALVRM